MATVTRLQKLYNLMVNRSWSYFFQSYSAYNQRILLWAKSTLSGRKAVDDDPVTYVFNLSSNIAFLVVDLGDRFTLESVILHFRVECIILHVAECECLVFREWYSRMILICEYQLFPSLPLQEQSVKKTTPASILHAGDFVCVCVFSFAWVARLLTHFRGALHGY